MGLKKVFQSGIETTFTVFTESVKEAEYSVITDNGFGVTSSHQESIRVILERFTQKDIETLAFSEEIQPTDSKGLIPFSDISVPVKVGHIIEIGSKKFRVVDFDIDPFEVLYTILMRLV